MSKILTKSVPVWITTDGKWHKNADEARTHQQKIDVAVVLADFFDETELDDFFGESYDSSAKSFVNDNAAWEALLRFHEAMNKALNPTEEGKF